MRAPRPVDLADVHHRVLMQVLGAQSQREVVRSRHRALAAMTAQAVEQGRFLSGRPPYGYRLVDAGPHPNRAHAAWGRRRQRLDPDPVTARHVRWIFAERLAGRSVAGIARELTERGVLCPSAADPGRNRHRGGQAWNLRSVAVILANPRYTGREVRVVRTADGRGGSLRGLIELNTPHHARATRRSWGNPVSEGELCTNHTTEPCPHPLIGRSLA